MAKKTFYTSTRSVVATPRSKRLRNGGLGSSAGTGAGSLGQTSGYIESPEDRGGKYVHMKFSAIENPSTAGDLLDTPAAYVGVYIDNDPVASTDPTRYQWTRFQGAPGKDGSSYSPNLLVNTETATITAPAGDDHSFHIYHLDKPLDVKAGDKFTVSVENIEVIDGAATEFSVYLYNIPPNDAYGSLLTITKNKPYATLTVDKDTTARTIIAYAGKQGSTSGNTVRYTNLMLARGESPMPWTPAASEMTGKNGQDGVNGKDGKDGRDGLMAYPAGVYDETTTYSSEGDTTPVVYQGGEYYALKAGVSFTGQSDPLGSPTPSDDIDMNGADARWVKVNRFNTIFTDVLMAKFAKLGSAVFYGDWMISQQGTVNGAPSTDYELFKDGSFLPTYAVNFRTGEVRIGTADAVITFKDGQLACRKMTATDVTVSSGTIAGFKVIGNMLTNEGLNNNASVIMSNSSNGTYAGIGGGVVAPSTGTSAAARFENKPQENYYDSVARYGLMLDVSGRKNNVALSIRHGGVEGMAMRNTIIGSGTGEHQLEHEDYNVLMINSSERMIVLPELIPADDGHVIRFKRLGTGLVKIRATACWVIDGASTTMSVPVIIYDRNEKVYPGGWIEMQSEGDSYELVWARDIPVEFNGTTYRGAWIQYKFPRDW